MKTQIPEPAPQKSPTPREVLPEALRHVRSRLVQGTCWGIGLAALALVLSWLISGDLQLETVIATGVLGAVLAGIGALARRGRVEIAAGLLVGLLMLLISVDSFSYGLESPGAAAYVLPIVLAACTLKWWTGIAVALLASAGIWLLAGLQVAGKLAGLSPELSILTFNAPFYTVIFLLVALIPGLWVRLITAAVPSSGARPPIEH